MKQYIPLLLSILLFSACTTIVQPKIEQQNKKLLYKLIMKSGSKIDPKEAKIISNEAISYSRKLSKHYGTTTTPLFHNFSVNVGIKDRGLCYHWSDDLYLYLRKYHFTTIQMKPVGAYIGSYWQEHNALVVLPIGSSDMNSGVLLDPWRDSGKLYFSSINNDPEYNWKIREDRCMGIVPKLSLKR
ncbi:MAG TPA: hypothetical protein EYG98_05890 [Sulfurovum sp.]|nr:hypothetical protein [Sulfurovum sp.]